MSTLPRTGTCCSPVLFTSSAVLSLFTKYQQDTGDFQMKSPVLPLPRIPSSYWVFQGTFIHVESITQIHSVPSGAIVWAPTIRLSAHFPDYSLIKICPFMFSGNDSSQILLFFFFSTCEPWTDHMNSLWIVLWPHLLLTSASPCLWSKALSLLTPHQWDRCIEI